MKPRLLTSIARGGARSLIGLKVHSEGLAPSARPAEDRLSAMIEHLLPSMPREGKIPSAGCFLEEESGPPRAMLRTCRAPAAPPGKR